MAEPRIRVAAILQDGETVLLVRQRGPHGEHWLLPGGGVERGETLAAALRREVREETGLLVEPGRLAILGESIAPRGDRHLVHLCFHARRTGELPGAPVDGVVRERRWWPLSSLGELALHPPIAAELLRTCRHGGRGGIISLGNTWE